MGISVCYVSGMNKNEFVDAVAMRSGLSKADADTAQQAVFAVITSELVSGERLPIPDFGIFNVKAKPARTGTNPSSGAPMEIAASTVAQFKPATALKKALNKK